MRLMPMLSLAMLASCGSVQSNQVSKSYPEVQSGGVNMLSPQSFDLHPIAAISRPNSELAQDFLRLEFALESGRKLLKLSRFEGPITVALTGNAPSTAQTELARLIQRFQSEAGLNISSTSNAQTASITVNFVAAGEMKRLVPTAACFVVPGVSSLDEYREARGTAAVDWAHIVVRTRVAVFIPDGTSPQEIRDCLHEELAQAMGPLNDLYELPDSVFNDDNFNTVLTDFDMLMLRLHYAPEMSGGMNEAKAASLIPDLLARYNPQGAYSTGRAIPSATPIAWTNLVAQAMGVGTGLGRSSAAEQMLQMAMAQGWRDGRLGLSYFLLGRLVGQTNPAKAVEYFSAAAEVYRALPNGALHAAHVDLQLAAIALSSNQNEQAVGFVDRAMGAVTAGQNAAMLTTLMLIKAEALEELGRDAEAQALRLDSQGWARYGFGSVGAMQAKSAEIAALGARG